MKKLVQKSIKKKEMAFIQVAYTDDKVLARLTTGEVQVINQVQDVPLYSTDSKDKEKEPISVKLDRVGPYKVVVHAFNSGSEKIPQDALRFGLSSTDGGQYVTYSKWENKVHDLCTGQTNKQWFQATQSFFIRGPVEYTQFSCYHTPPGKTFVLEFFIEIHYLS